MFYRDLSSNLPSLGCCRIGSKPAPKIFCLPAGQTLSVLPIHFVPRYIPYPNTLHILDTHHTSDTFRIPDTFHISDTLCTLDTLGAPRRL